MRTVDNYARLGQVIKPLFYDRLTILPNEKSIRTILEKHPKLVWTVSHGPGFAPAFINTALQEVLLKNGGAERRQLMIAWKHFYKIPLLKQLIQHFSQLEQPLHGDEIIQKFSSENYNDFIVYPEGENSIYGDGTKIEEFVSPRFLEVAIAAEAPVLIAAHYGSQKSASKITLSEKQVRWIKKLSPKAIQKLAKPGDVYLPGFQYSKTPEFKVIFKLYKPKLTLTSLPAEPADRQRALAKEAEKIRKIMQGLLNEITGVNS
ncbi:Uncharacterised protein [BD1-7 clade bacterium]|uniref:Phospholipid/glycerol acyltransferase domain-containing protein n=1 Tax=BD1-7 clade bacterium TaxID=2029982 RepID=A0A5S9PL50_9GAMM|nr:Uncharacterised protein [BD1-7 clade bacterium]